MTVWQLLVLLLMAVLANTKVLVQGKFGRSMVKTTQDVVGYNGLLFVFAALSFFVLFFEPRFPSATTLLLAALFGVANVLFQLCYLSAMKSGPVSITVLIANFAVIPTSLFGVIAYGEPFSWIKCMGLLLIVISFFLTVKPSAEERSFNWKWLLLALSAAVCSASCTLLQKSHQHTAFSEERSLFVTYAYIVAALISAVLVLLMRAKGNRITFRLQFSLLWPALLTGFVLALYQFLVLWLAGEMDSMVMFPVNSSTCILVSFLFGILFFKDRLSVRQWIGSAIGIAAVVLISL